MDNILLYLLASLGYLALAFVFWRNSMPAAASPAVSRFAHAALVVPLVLHASVLSGGIFAEDGFYLGVGTAVSVIIWLTALIYWLGSFFYRFEGLQVLVLPAAAVLSLLPLVLPPAH